MIAHMAFVRSDPRLDRRPVLMAMATVGVLPAFPTGGYAINFDIEKDIPYKETREYVDRALEAQQTYRDLYGKNLQSGPG